MFKARKWQYVIYFSLRNYCKKQSNISSSSSHGNIISVSNIKDKSNNMADILKFTNVSYHALNDFHMTNRLILMQFIK